MKERERERERERTKRIQTRFTSPSPGSLMPLGALFKGKFDRKLNPSNNEDKLRQ